MKYEGLSTCEAIPEASSMIETFRAIGYSLDTAVADIIDNSLTAGATRVEIQRFWRGGDSVITITDNGSGMTNDELINAMRPGAQNPLDVRSENDLGRFGLGLKTASFSQCRRLSVITKKDDEVSYWTWDLDYIAQCQKWNLLHWVPDEFCTFPENLTSGTIIIWSALDRIIPLDTSILNESYKEKFSSALDHVRLHLSMTFHRFIESKSCSIIWGKHEIEPWNPFCTDECKLQIFPEEILPGNVKMKGYVLPHKSNFSDSASYDTAQGINGWNAHQGFYVYRGKRLLLAGSWLGMFRKEEHYKLARILIDLPNNQDQEWQIDIKKSRAYPPTNCREQIEQYAKKIRSEAENVFRHRGKIVRQRIGLKFYPLWLDKQKDGNWTYVVNRESPLIQSIRTMSITKPEKAFNLLLSILETNVPTKTIFIHESKEEDKEDLHTLTDLDTITNIIQLMYKSFLDQDLSSEQAKQKLKSIEPFNYYEDYIDSL